jgi:hypothetical protein
MEDGLIKEANIFAQHLEKILDTLPVLKSNDYLDEIPLVTPREVPEEIRTNLNSKTAPGFDLITGEILKNFKRKAFGQTDYINQCLHSAKLYPKCMENC